jgi:hypothetical protein
MIDIYMDLQAGTISALAPEDIGTRLVVEQVMPIVIPMPLFLAQIQALQLAMQQNGAGNLVIKFSLPTGA